MGASIGTITGISNVSLTVDLFSWYLNGGHVDTFPLRQLCTINLVNLGILSLGNLPTSSIVSWTPLLSLHSIFLSKGLDSSLSFHTESHQSNDINDKAFQSFQTPPQRPCSRKPTLNTFVRLFISTKWTLKTALHDRMLQ